MRTAPLTVVRIAVMALAALAISMVAGRAAEALDATTKSSGSWSSGSIWTTDPLYPNGPDDIARIIHLNLKVDSGVPGGGPTVGALYLRMGSSTTLQADPGMSLSLDVSSGSALVQADSGPGREYRVAPHVVLFDPTVVRVVNETLELRLYGGVSSGVPGTGLTKKGLGTLILEGPNTFTGPVTVAEGVLKAQDGLAFGTWVGGVTVADGAALELSGHPGFAVIDEPLEIGGSGIGGTGVLRNVSGHNAWTGPVTLRSDTVVAAELYGSFNERSTLTLNGPVSDGGAGCALTKVAPGRVVLNGPNSYCGHTTVAEGYLKIHNDTALGTSAAGTTVSEGAVLEIEGGVTVVGEALEVTGTGENYHGVVINRGDSNTWTGPVTLGSDSTFAVDRDTLEFSGGLTDGGAGYALTKIGNGTLVLSAPSTYTGKTVIGVGAVRANDGVGLPTASNLCFEPVKAGEHATWAAKGVLEGLGPTTFARSLGAGPGEVHWETAGGFSAHGGKMVVNIGGSPTPSTLVWGSPHFKPGKGLRFGSLTADSETDFRNPLDLDGNEGFVHVTDNPDVNADFARLSGVVSNGALSKTGDGTLVLSAANTYTGNTFIREGTLRAVDGIGLPAASNLILAGVYEAEGPTTFTRSFGSGPGEVRWSPWQGSPTSGGFSAYGGKLTVNLNGKSTPKQFCWSYLGIQFLMFGSPCADSEVEFQNSLCLCGDERHIVVYDNPDSTGDFATISGKIQNGAIRKRGPGTLVFSAANTYGGRTRVLDGVLRILNNSALGTAPTVTWTSVSSGAALEMAGGLWVGNTEYLSISGSGVNGGGALRSTAGANEWSGKVSLGTDAAIGVDSGSLVISGEVHGKGLRKVGDGRLVLTHACTYMGPTTIEEGTLALSGSGHLDSDRIEVADAATYDVQGLGTGIVDFGTTLTGDGTVLGDLLVRGIVAPGGSPGDLSVDDVFFASGSRLEIELAGRDDYDCLVSNGTVTLQAGCELDVSLLDGFVPAFGDEFDILDFTELDGSFGGVFLPDLDPHGLSWDQSRLYSDGIVDVVPEPATLLLVGGWAALLLARKRRLAGALGGILLLAVLGGTSARAEGVHWQGTGTGGTGTDLDEPGFANRAWGGTVPDADDDAVIALSLPGQHGMTTTTWAGAGSLTVTGGPGVVPDIICVGQDPIQFGRVDLDAYTQFDLGSRELIITGDLVNEGTVNRTKQSWIQVDGEFLNAGSYLLRPDALGYTTGMSGSCGWFVNTGEVRSLERGGKVAGLGLTHVGAFLNQGTILVGRPSIQAGSFVNDTGATITTMDENGSVGGASDLRITADAFVNRGTINTGRCNIKTTGAVPGRNEGTIHIYEGTQWGGGTFSNLVNTPSGLIHLTPVAGNPYEGYLSALEFHDFTNQGTIQIDAVPEFVELEGEMTNDGLVEIDPSNEIWTRYFTLKGSSAGRLALPEKVRVQGTFDIQLTDGRCLDMTGTAIRGGYWPTLEAASTGDSFVDNFAIGAIEGGGLGFVDQRDNTSVAGEERVVVRDYLATGDTDMADVPMTVLRSWENQGTVFGEDTELKILGTVDRVGKLVARRGTFRVLGLQGLGPTVPDGAVLRAEEGGCLHLVRCTFHTIAGSVELDDAGSRIPAVETVRAVAGRAYIGWGATFETQDSLVVRPGGEIYSRGTFAVTGDLTIEPGASIQRGPFVIHGDLVLQSTAADTDLWGDRGSAPQHRPRIQMVGGTGIDPFDGDLYAALEVCGHDEGEMTGWDSWRPLGTDPGFFFNTLTIGPGAHVKLVDLVDNGFRGGPAGDAEALYVKELAFGDADSRLWLNDLHLYYHTLSGDPEQIVSEPIPEPATLGLLAAGLAAVWMRKRRVTG